MKTLSLALIFLISLALYLLGKQIPKEVIETFVKSAGPWAPIVYILIHQISYVIAPISGLPFLIAGFYLFGKTVVIYTFLAVPLGASINFWLARKWGRPLIAKFTGKEALQKIDELAQEYGVVTLIALRILQGGIGDFVSYAYGLTPIKFSTYILITILATIPGSILWYYVVSKTNSIEQSLAATILLIFLSAIIFFAGNYLVRKYRKRNSNF